MGKIPVKYLVVRDDDELAAEEVRRLLFEGWGIMGQPIPTGKGAVHYIMTNNPQPQFPTMEIPPELAKKLKG